MRAYSDLYVGDAQRKLGSMLDYAVNGYGMSLPSFYGLFLCSGLSKQFATGEPSVIAGRSGIELALEILQSDGEDGIIAARSFTPVSGATPEYWTGWALAYYQWECGRAFDDIAKLVSIEDVASLYHPYHEMDITQFCDCMDSLCATAQPCTNLKKRRLEAGLSQSELAFASGIPLRTIQQYEQGRKDINKAQVVYAVQLARALRCDVMDIIEYSSRPHYEYAQVSV